MLLLRIQEIMDGRNGFGRGAEMWAVAAGVEDHERAVGEVLMHVLTNTNRRDRIWVALQNNGRRLYSGKIAAAIGQKSYLGKVFRYLRICAAKAVGKLGGEFGTIWILHDDRGHGLSPTERIAIEKVQQAIDISFCEASDIIAIVDVARGGADENELFKKGRRCDGCQESDHSAHRVADKNDAFEFEFAAYLQNVLRIALERAVFNWIEESRIRVSKSDEIEKNDFVVVLKSRC